MQTKTRSHTRKGPSFMPFHRHQHSPAGVKLVRKWLRHQVGKQMERAIVAEAKLRGAR